MKLLLPGIVKRILCSPTVIIGEIVAIALTGVLGATFPQAGLASAEELGHLREAGPVVRALVNFFALDHIFQSGWFLVILLLATASLSIVVIDQIRRLRLMWSLRLTEAQFQRAPFRAEFERPARLAVTKGKDVPSVEVRTERRLGLAGSSVFHVGLLLVVVAGALRTLLAVEAVVDLIEKETLRPIAEAWAAQWPGMLAKPFRLNYPVTLDAVRAMRYDSGELRDLSIRLSFKLAEGVQDKEIAINRELEIPGGRLFLDSNFGPAALLEWQKDETSPVREAVLLAGKGKGLYEGSSSGSVGMRAYLRANVDQAGNQPTRIEVRVVDGRALLFAGLVRVGEAVPLPNGHILKLHGVPFWARLRGSRDPALWLAYAGFVLVVAGAAIMFIVVKVDTCVSVVPAGDRERVFVALRPQRFAPLFQERFERLVREQGGQA